MDQTLEEDDAIAGGMNETDTPHDDTTTTATGNGVGGTDRDGHDDDGDDVIDDGAITPTPIPKSRRKRRMPNMNMPKMKINIRPCRFRDRDCRSLSRLYMFFICAYGLALALGPIISNGLVARLLLIVFYCLLYLIAIAFLMYVHCYLLKDGGKPTRNRNRLFGNSMAVYSLNERHTNNSSKEKDDDFYDLRSGIVPKPGMPGYESAMHAMSSSTPEPENSNDRYSYKAFQLPQSPEPENPNDRYSYKAFQLPQNPGPENPNDRYSYKAYQLPQNPGPENPKDRYSYKASQLPQNPEPENPKDRYSYKVLQLPQSLPKVTVFHRGEGSYTNFYLRVGSIAFGLGITLYCGLKIVDAGYDISCETATDYVYGFIALKFLLFVFTFCQLYFTFRHSKISINVHQSLAKFGLMHIFATNICTWFLIFIWETENAIMHISLDSGMSIASLFAESSDCTMPNVTTTTVIPDLLNITDPCNAVEPIVDALQPYLYPCIVQYSVIMAAAVYQISGNIGLYQRMKKSQQQQVEKEKKQIPFTCHRSYIGLFTGIAFFILTIIGVVLYNVLYEYEFDQEYSKDKAAVLYFALQFTILCALIVATAMAWWKIQQLSFEKWSVPSLSLNKSLTMISVLGVYLYDAFNLVHALYNPVVYKSLMGILRPLLSSAEATVQVLFIFDGIHRLTSSSNVSKHKPGREWVMLTMMLNICLFFVYTFQGWSMFNEHSFHNLYLMEAWVVITHLTIPLLIFFRFHSTTCLYEIWKYAYANPN